MKKNPKTETSSILSIMQGFTYATRKTKTYQEQKLGHFGSHCILMLLLTNAQAFQNQISREWHEFYQAGNGISRRHI